MSDPAGIGEKRLAGGSTFAVELREAGAGHDHLAAHLEHSGDVRLAKRVEPERYGADGAQVGRDIVAGNAIAAGGAAGEQAVLKPQADRNAVGLRLDDPLERLAGQELLNADNELAHLRLRVGVVEAHHRHRVPDRLEAVDRRAADALAGGVGCAELRVGRLEIEQLAVKLVVVAVADRRLRLNIISPVMPANLLRQPRVPLL